MTLMSPLVSSPRAASLEGAPPTAVLPSSDREGCEMSSVWRCFSWPMMGNHNSETLSRKSKEGSRISPGQNS